VDGAAEVVKDQDELAEWWRRGGRKRRKVGVIAQTTIDFMLFRSLVDQLVGRVAELKVMDTLCHSTTARQQEARRLAFASDFVLVLGGHNSSNTNFLRKISLLSGTPTLQLETPEELDIDVLAGVGSLAILGGASTPEWIVEGVREKVRKAYPGKV
jgi:4-hydroxy-3-methylbut-2-enyl diphosphate reductase